MPDFSMRTLFMSVASVSCKSFGPSATLIPVENSLMGIFVGWMATYGPALDPYRRLSAIYEHPFRLLNTTHTFPRVPTFLFGSEKVPNEIVGNGTVSATKERTGPVPVKRVTILLPVPYSRDTTVVTSFGFCPKVARSTNHKRLEVPPTETRDWEAVQVAGLSG
jgi:hypothetical protein